MTEILLKVVLKTIKQTKTIFYVPADSQFLLQLYQTNDGQKIKRIGSHGQIVTGRCDQTNYSYM
jgi:hypothetical protein